MQISELRPNAKKIDLVFKVLSKGEVRDVVAKMSGQPLKVCEATVGDASGTVLLSLWNEDIERVEVGKSYKLTNGYVTTFRNSIRLNVGKYGQLEESEEPVDEVNEGNNVSEKEFEEAKGF